MFIRRAIAMLGVLAVAGLSARAQDAGAPSPVSTFGSAARSIARGGSTANVVPGTFRAQLVVDNRFKLPVKNADGSESPDPRNRTGKIHCLVCEHGLSPVVAVFVRADVSKLRDSDGLSKLIKGTDILVPKYRSDKLAAFAMFLKPLNVRGVDQDGGTKVVTIKDMGGAEEKVPADLEYPDDEKRDEKVAEIKNYFGVVNADNVPFGLAPATSTATTAFALSEAPVTVIIYNRFRIAQRWEFKLEEITDEKVAEILSGIEAMVSGKRE